MNVKKKFYPTVRFWDDEPVKICSYQTRRLICEPLRRFSNKICKIKKSYIMLLINDIQAKYRMKWEDFFQKRRKSFSFIGTKKPLLKYKGELI